MLKVKQVIMGELRLEYKVWSEYMIYLDEVIIIKLTYVNTLIKYLK